ncbi:hypothetical protein ACVW0K_001597 [Streptomyces filamentosus]|uniref:hypothetical protein n=1 Tax=Streptomyces filamentosus TaxID=67294 RepID=UPI0036E213A1
MSEAMPDAPEGTGEPGAEAYDSTGPLGVAREATGLPAVDGLLERLGEVDGLPADGHLAVYEDVHRGLRAELTSLDERPAPASRPHDPRS